jgi:hypothetical protein
LVSCFPKAEVLRRAKAHEVDSRGSRAEGEAIQRVV